MEGSLAASFRVQWTIVHALMLQEMSSRYARSRFGIFTAIIEPVLVILAMFVIRRYIQGQTSVGGIPIVMFVVTGFATDFCFRIVTGVVITSTERKSSSRMFPQITSFDVIASRAISYTVIGAGTLIVVFFIAAVVQKQMPYDFLICFVAGWLIFALATPVGILMGVILRQFPIMRVFVGSLLRINFVLSGAAFLGTEIPRKMLHYVSWNPTFHIVELMREGWFRGYVSPVANPFYIIVWILGILAIALPLERITSKGQIK